MRLSDSGEGYRRAIVALAILSVLAYVAIKTVPVYVENYELANYLRDLAVRATVQRPSVAALEGEVVARARGLGLPVARENLKVVVTESEVRIDLDYKVPVDLKICTLNLHFAPSTHNRSL